MDRGEHRLAHVRGNPIAGDALAQRHGARERVTRSRAARTGCEVRLDLRARRLVDLGRGVRRQLVRELGARLDRIALEQAGEPLAHRQARAVQTALERADVDADDLGRFARRQPLDVAQHEHLALLGGQLADRGGERLADAARVGLGVGSGTARRERVVERLGRPRTAALLDAEAARDLVQPGRERGIAAECAEVAKRREHRLLQDLARGVLVAAHAQPEAVDRLLVAREQLVDRAPVTSARGGDQLGVLGHRSSIARESFPAQLAPTGMTIEITAQNFEQTVTKGIVVLDWWAAWCGPCRTFAPIFERAAAGHPDIVFGKVDTDAQPELAGAFAIRSIPTLMVFRDGILVFEQPGALSLSALDRLIAEVRALDMADVRAQAS
jgi:thioredoxin 1